MRQSGSRHCRQTVLAADRTAAVRLWSCCRQALAPEPHAVTSVQVQGSQRNRWPPFPLSTLEMQKKATSSLRIPGERIMKLAEELYQEGYLSYPRTETDKFDPGYDLMVCQSPCRTCVMWLWAVRSWRNGCMFALFWLAACCERHSPVL